MLTDKQEKFVQGLIEGKSQREAYKAAYNAENMSDKTIDEEASKLFANPKINTRYNEIRDRLIKEAEDECIVNAKKVIEELAHIAFDDIKNYLSFKTVKTQVGVDKETGEPILDYRTVVELKDSEEIDTRNIAEISTGPNGVFKFKQYCKDNALVQLGRHLGLFNDKLALGNVDGKDFKISVEYVDNN